MAPRGGQRLQNRDADNQKIVGWLMMSYQIQQLKEGSLYGSADRNCALCGRHIANDHPIIEAVCLMAGYASHIALMHHDCARQFSKSYREANEAQNFYVR